MSAGKRILLAFHWYLESLHKGALRGCMERGFEAEVLNRDTLPALRQESFAGVVSMLAIEKTHPVTDFVLGLKTPVVELSRAFPEKTNWGRVPEDCEIIARSAAGFLKQRPVKSFVFVAHYPWWNHDRRVKFFLGELAGDVRPAKVIFLSELGGAENAVEPLAKILATLPAPVGIFGSVDETARIAAEAAAHAGLKIPRDAVILGFGNRELVSKWAPLPISSMTIDYEQWGFAAATLLCDMLAGKEPPGTVKKFAPGGIVERRSTGLDPAGEALCERATAHIRADFSKPLSVPALAKKLGVSKATLERAFDREYGCGVAKKALRLRIDHAGELLRRGTKTEAVAAACGFRSYRAVISAFRRVHNTTPGNFLKTKK